MKHITINHYTGNWQKACNPVSPAIGELVRIHDEADAREYDDFCRCLKSNKLDREFDSWMPRLKMNVYRIVTEKQD